MSKIFYSIIIIVICQACTRQLILINKTFIDDDPFKTNSLQFINDSICIYKQLFLCDIDEQYKETKIRCSYKINENMIILRNLMMQADSNNILWLKLPESEITKCYFLRDELLGKKPILIGAPPNIPMTDIYGYINNITTDTLIYKKRTIYYNKRNTYIEYPVWISIELREKK